MINIQKIGTYFFILGALIAILSAAFPIGEGMGTVVLLLLIITGAFVGLLNIEEEREMHFLIAVGAFIISTKAIDEYLIGLELLGNFATMLSNLIIFSATAGVVVGLKLIFHYASVREERSYEEELAFVDPKKESVWNMVIFITVCLAFVLFILEAFFYTNGLTPFLIYLSWVIIIIFVIDAIVLYGRSKNTGKFLRYHWIDIVAIIPFSGAFQLAKFLRIARIVRTAGRTSKLARISKISHSTKFFSGDSGFNKYLKKKD